MDKSDDLTLKIERLIEEEKTKNPDIKYLTKEHAKLIAEIIKSYNLKAEDTQVEGKAKAEMLFIGAPTGAGKDTLVRKAMQDDREKDFVVLNMDMFRYYHNEIASSEDKVLDRDFALRTNQTSYELYYIIQEYILREHPGTNVIITGTMKDLEWVKEIMARYKNDPKTDYSVSLLTLAVPTNESAFSIYERYLNLVDTRGDSDLPLRYTDLKYHNATIKDFISNVDYFEKELESNPKESKIDSIRVYRRNKDMFDLSEDTLMYDSQNREEGKSAVSTIDQIMERKDTIDTKRAIKVLSLIKDNSSYLKQQGLYKEILCGLQTILPQINKQPIHDDVDDEVK